MCSIGKQCVGRRNTKEKYLTLREPYTACLGAEDKYLQRTNASSVLHALWVGKEEDMRRKED